MSDNMEAPAGVPAKKSGGGAAMMLIGAILSAIASGGTSYAAVHAATKNLHAGGAEHAAESTKDEPPGPTMALDPFLVSIPDTNKKLHPMKLTVAVEFGAHTKEEAIKAYTPRIRDAVLSHMRAVSYEDASDIQHTEKLRGELLEKCRAAGAATAERVLITDMVSQ